MLVEHGSDPQDLRVELPHPELKGSRIDLVVGQPPSAFIEFKYPREPNEKNAAWTMTLGEVLKDFYRLAACPGAAERLFVYVETPRLRRYMAGIAQRHGIALDVDEVVLPPDAMAQLPMTARRSIGVELPTSYVRARRSVAVDVDDGLRLNVYQVDPHL
ncbi:hypothetical protein [Nocardiopsis sp. NRRL B-16309]|uniref:hypothetical protein n=1 Tax=Nocardiopsis sp. NRRL B-16309 TaxID=1519494 RepID=UPI000AB23F3C|nr:hypothetical protein [Nocardiopsis sp. NRRL B-16309]